MKLLLGILMLGATAQADQVTYEQVYPVFARNCASCHNAQTPGRNWLDRGDTEAKRTLIYTRVFVQGDMPLYFRVFGGADKRLLQRYLEQSTVEMGNER